MKNGIFQVHWLLGMTAGLVLAIVGMTGSLMSFERQIMEAISPHIVRVEMQELPLLTPDELMVRFQAQRPGASIEQITLWSDEGRSALIRTAGQGRERRGDELYVNPYTGDLLGQITGEQFFRTVRSLHRWLLIPPGEGGLNIGRQITGFCALALVFFALSGLYLRWPRRPFHWRSWFRIDFSLKGRNFYWALHSVIGTWVLVVYLLLAFTGLTWSYAWFKNGATIVLTGEPMEERPAGFGDRRSQGNGDNRRSELMSAATPRVSLNPAWTKFIAETNNRFKLANIMLPRNAADSIRVSAVAIGAIHDRQRSNYTFDAHSGELISAQPYKPNAHFGKRIMQGIYELHTGEWFGLPGRIINMLASSLMVLFTVTGFLLYLDRRKKKRMAKLAAEGVGNEQRLCDYLIVYASQTGTAERLAWNTAMLLKAGGVRVRVKPISALDTRTLDLEIPGKSAEEPPVNILWVLSTFGEGEAPDMARGFVRNLLKTSPSLDKVQYAILGLGDTRYRDYCGFAAQVEQWLMASGAQPLFSRINVDNGEQTAIQQWQKRIANISGVDQVTDWASPGYEEWRLQNRCEINSGSVGAPVYRVSLQPSVPGNTHWQAGDILEIKPHNNSELPHRDYSIASLPKDGVVDLVVRQAINEKGEVGLGSGWLTIHAEEGGSVLARIRTNPSFHAPQVDCPMILIGSGTGIAGLRAHLQERYQKDHQQNWLIFGERQRNKDRLFAKELDAWKESGFLTELDEVYSRDGEGYVQDVFIARQQALGEWLEKGAVLYVCGSLAMGAGVEKTLIAILGEKVFQQLIDEGRYKRDIY